MSANNIAETSTSTGTGNLTLAGAIVDAANYVYGQTFNSFYGLNHVFPYRIEDAANNWELGEGYLSASTTLVRVNVFNNSLGTTAKIDFPAGTKRVYVPTDARAYGSRMLNKVAYSLTGQAVGIRGTLTLTANTMYVAPHLIIAPCRLTTIAFRVTALAAGSTMRVGIYNLTKQSDTGNDYDSTFTLLADLGTVDTSTTGIKPIAVDLKLGQGVYGFAVVSNGAPQIMATGTNIVWTGSAGNTFENNPVSYWSASNAAYHTALPATTPGAMAATMNAGAPQAMLRGGIQ
jgi:hypothetical protein